MVTISKIRYAYLKNNQHASVVYVTCESADRCPLHAQGRCACFEYLLGANMTCPSGEWRYIKGPTPRARSFYDWVSNAKREYESTARESKDKIAVTADHIFIPVPYMNDDDIEGLTNKNFIAKDAFTPEKIQEIVTYVPRTLWGEPIKNKASVARFVQQLKEEMPDIYSEWAEKYPETAGGIRISNVGRNAYVKTLPDGAVLKGTFGEFVKKGDRLCCDNYRNIIFDGKFGSDAHLKIEVRIEDDMVYEVKENTLTDEKTKYAD